MQAPCFGLDRWLCRPRPRPVGQDSARRDRWPQAGVAVIRSRNPASALPPILFSPGPCGFGELEFSRPQRSLCIRSGGGKNRDSGGKSAWGLSAPSPPPPEAQPRGQVCWLPQLRVLGPPRKGRARHGENTHRPSTILQNEGLGGGMRATSGFREFLLETHRADRACELCGGALG